MFWHRFGVETSGWHNVPLFTEDCDALSSPPLSFFHLLSFGIAVPAS